MLILRRIGFALVAFVLLCFSVWSAAALLIDGPLEGNAALGLAGAWGILCLVVVRGVRPGWRALVAIAALNVVVVGWWLGIEARNDRDWVAETAQLAHVQQDGNSVRFRGVRNFEYRAETDFTPRWEERSYDLSTVVAADLFISYWGAPVIAHTIMSWEFADGRHLAVSIETRKEVGEEYSAVLGFFRQFEIYYVVADERDVVGVRTNHRGETVYLYRLSATPEEARELLQDYIESIAELDERGAWYNAITHNCTTTIWEHARRLGRGGAWDWRILANGSADAMLYLRGSIDTTLPFEELRERSNITLAAQSAADDEKFSERIRRGLPRMVQP